EHSTFNIEWKKIKRREEKQKEYLTTDWTDRKKKITKKEKNAEDNKPRNTRTTRKKGKNNRHRFTLIRHRRTGQEKKLLPRMNAN
ncbi:MAG: hypothetical protein KAJ52_08560, partial [Sedimentisphaerales bacterium]|nr:hypothetical protein [Sedimentisphaerales bacterium]